MNKRARTARLVTSVHAHVAAFAMMGVVAAACLFNSSAQAQLIVTPNIESFTTFFGDRSPTNLVNSSGLTAGLSGILGAADSTHSADVSEMWYSDPFVTPPDTTPIVTFDLGGLYDIETTRLWQFNQSPYDFTVFGAAEIELSFSSDNTNFTAFAPTFFPTRAGGTNGEPAQDFTNVVTGVQYVRLQIWISFGGAQATGLSEVRFLVTSNTAPPVITSQPLDQTVALGATAMFAVTATGPTPINPQWRFNGTNLTDGGDISGATTTNLVVSNATLASEGEYDVVLSNVNGPVTSSKAILTIGSPIITQEPQDATLLVGQTTNFTVAATDFGGSPLNLTYQWIKGTNDLVDGGNISGATTTNLTVSNVDTNDNESYSVRVTDTIINKDTLSENALLTAVPVPAIGVELVVNPILVGGIDSVSSFYGPRPPERLVDSSGLTNGLSGIPGGADATHGNAEGTYWYADPFLTPPDTSPWVIIDLGGTFDIATTRIWQYNQPGGFTVYGAAEVEVSFSADNTTFTTNAPNLFPAQAGGTNGEPAQDFSTPAAGVRYVRLHNLVSFAGVQVTGLSEVRFVAAGGKSTISIDNGVVGLHYQVDYRDSLNPADPWQLLADIPALPNSPFTVTDSTPVGSQTERYYRAVWIP